jgi:hypothetical protein
MAWTRTTAASPNTALFERACALGLEITIRMGELVEIVDELDRSQAFRDEGATSAAAWLTERLGISEATARGWARVGQRLWNLPMVAKSLRSGEISFDKARALADLIAASSDDSGSAGWAGDTESELLKQARTCTVRQLDALTRTVKGVTDAAAAAHYDHRHLHCNDARRSIAAQFTEDDYARIRTALLTELDSIPSDGETPFDQRMCDALVQLMVRGRYARGASQRTHTTDDPDAARDDADVDVDVDAVDGEAVMNELQEDDEHEARRRQRADTPLVVLHADLAYLQTANGLAEVERLGLLSREGARRLACDAHIALAIDDAFGHTMAEGRRHRFPTDAQRREVRRRDRQCRFPGCANAVFTNVHHIVHWADGGKTDLVNLVLLCNHHHHLVHEKRWHLSGNGNAVLTFVGPTERMMTSSPSPLWTRRN